MGQYSSSAATTTNFDNNIDNFSVNPEVPDQSSEYGEGFTWWDYPNSNEYLGYFKSIPELKSAIKVLCMRVVGQGYDLPLLNDKTNIENWVGQGKDNFYSILANLLTQKKVFGDAFAEIIRNDRGRIINLKPLYTGNMRTVFDNKGLIDHYEQRIPGKKPIKFAPEKIFHLTNDRIANEIHGTSIIPVLKMIIDAKNEALSDERKIRHRELAYGAVEVDSSDPTEFSNLATQIQNAVNNGEILMLPKDLAQFKDVPNNPRDRIQWLNYLDNLFYQIVGIPKVLVTSEGYTEAGGKAGLIAFEPNEIAEKLEFEADFWGQLAIKIHFARSPSITAAAQSNQAANTGQTNIQPNDTQLKVNRQ